MPYNVLCNECCKFLETPKKWALNGFFKPSRSAKNATFQSNTFQHCFQLHKTILETLLKSGRTQLSCIVCHLHTFYMVDAYSLAWTRETVSQKSWLSLLVFTTVFPCLHPKFHRCQIKNKIPLNWFNYSFSCTLERELSTKRAAGYPFLPRRQCWTRWEIWTNFLPIILYPSFSFPSAT